MRRMRRNDYCLRHQDIFFFRPLQSKQLCCLVFISRWSYEGYNKMYVTEKKKEKKIEIKIKKQRKQKKEEQKKREHKFNFISSSNFIAFHFECKLSSNTKPKSSSSFSQYD